MPEKNKFYVTTPIYYVTAKPHLGSLYSTLLADVAARWAKLSGKKTFFLTGTDEHGQKVAAAAEKAGKSPKEFVDSFIPSYKKIWQEYGINYNHFIRTTDPEHISAVQKWIADLLKKDEIYKSVYRGWYCVSDETFVAEIHDSVTPQEAPLCPSCQRKTIEVSEDSYFFRLSKYQDKLLEFYKNNPDFITPKERLNEVISFVKEGLKDLSISRTTVKWGIPFPGDPEHTVYVWADALNNYITAIGYGQPHRKDEFEFFWPADLHVLGKDIVRFHAVFWPAFLMAADLAMPKKLLVHGWIKVGEQKMSKSLGNAIDPEEIFKKYGPDPVRYYLTRHMAITQDSEFSIPDLEQKVSSELANDLGNLLNRTSALAQKNNLEYINSPRIWSVDSLELRNQFWDVLEQFELDMQDCFYNRALNNLWRYINLVNAYFHKHEPWKLAKSNPELFHEVMAATCNSLHCIAILLLPVMPHKMEDLLESIGIELDFNKNIIAQLEDDNWEKQFKITPIAPLFEKIELKEENLNSGNKMQENIENKETLKNYITIDDFLKVELLVGTIKQCEEIAGSDKLLKLQVDFGPSGIKQILSGIKKSFAPEDLINKQAVFVFNLAPRTMMKLESNGMLLTAGTPDGKLSLVSPAVMVENGTRLK